MRPPPRSRLGRLALATLLVSGVASCGEAPSDGSAWIELSGPAFGTTWHVRVPQARDAARPARVAEAVQEELAAVDAALSTWRDDSELARFNARRAPGWQPVSTLTARVVAEALAVHARSEGALDPTLGPLLELWGFGPGSGTPGGLPDAAARRDALARTGVGGLALRRDPPALRKRRASLALDLSAVAEGFAVDAIALRLEKLGHGRFLVEIGGELLARGEGPEGGGWRVGIERPSSGPVEVGWVVELEDEALATSGTLRRRRALDGRALPHVLDPRDGRPVRHPLRSVSVRAPRAARADAWATALLVLGPEEGWRVARRESLAALFVSETKAGALVARATPDFRVTEAAPGTVEGSTPRRDATRPRNGSRRGPAGSGARRTPQRGAAHLPEAWQPGGLPTRLRPGDEG